MRCTCKSELRTASDLTELPGIGWKLDICKREIATVRRGVAAFATKKQSILLLVVFLGSGLQVCCREFFKLKLLEWQSPL